MDDKTKKKPLAPVDTDGKKRVVAGYEYLCPGREKHLGLRYRDRPATGIDGDDFPMETWEKSPLFLGAELPFQMAMGLTGRAGAPPGLKYPPDLAKNEAAQAALVPILKKWVLEKPVTAWWFVVHDTASLVPMQPQLVVRAAAKRIHLFVGLTAGKEKHDGVVVQVDFGDKGNGAKFETLHPEFGGKLLHIELNHTADDKAVEPCTEFQYDALLRLYLFASYRAGKWLTVASHREVDRGIAVPGKGGKPNTGHWDPRGFDFERFYRMVAKAVGLPEDKTFGIMQSRHDFAKGSFLEHRNTFPVQYGPVQIEDFMPVRVPGWKGGIVPNRPVPIVESSTEKSKTPSPTTTPDKTPAKTTTPTKKP